jgi:hypothetical protein
VTEIGEATMEIPGMTQAASQMIRFLLLPVLAPVASAADSLNSDDA